jgi:hypothetical protein
MDEGRILGVGLSPLARARAALEALLVHQFQVPYASGTGTDASAKAVSSDSMIEAPLSTNVDKKSTNLTQGRMNT